MRQIFSGNIIMRVIVIDLVYLCQMLKIFRLCCGSDEPSQKKPSQPSQKSQKINAKCKKIINTMKCPPVVNSIPSSFMSQSRNNIQIIKRTISNRYEGEQLDGEPHGSGSMLYSNGDFYRGQWVNGKKQGRGLQIYQQTNREYEGEWRQNQPNGNGKLTEPNFSYYVGEFKNGLRHGKGHYFDKEKNIQFNEIYEDGTLLQQNEINIRRSNEDQFPTLNLDKQRFNTQDLRNFQENNPKIQTIDIYFLLKYYGLCKLTALQTIAKGMKEWTLIQVLDFLEAIQMNKYKQVFYKNKIKGRHLITLTEMQMKQDLKMKIGDRKRFINFLKCVTDLEVNPQIEEKIKKKLNKNQKGKEKRPSGLRGANNQLKSAKFTVYTESIRQESFQSEEDSIQFLKNMDSKKKDESERSQNKFPSPQMQKYGSAAEQIHNSKNSLEKASLEQLLQPPKSQRSQARSSFDKKQNVRKNSRDDSMAQLTQFLLNKTHQNLTNKQCDMSFDKIQRFSEDEKKRESDQEEKNQQQGFIQDNFLKIHLQRKNTCDKVNLQLHTSQIRELYDFLKEHRSLSFFIKEKDIQRLQEIGQGGYGKVYKGKYVGQLIAIKDYMKTSKPRHKQDFMKELEIISDLKHPNIVLYMGICITANKYTLITQYLQNGSLFDQLHKKGRKFSQMQQISIAYDIVKGMVYLHNMKKILHRDLKSSNVLMGENWQVKLCDFGLSGQKHSNKKGKGEKMGTYQWMAPEVVRGEDKIDQFADVYSFGVIIWELLTQRVPLHELSPRQVVRLGKQDQLFQLEATNCNPFLTELMRTCLHREPTQRPSFMELQALFEDKILPFKEKL